LFRLPCVMPGAGNKRKSRKFRAGKMHRADIQISEAYVRGKGHLRSMRKSLRRKKK